MAAFLYIGFFIGEDTPFRAIRALPPNAKLEWRGGRLTISGQMIIPKPQALSRDEAIDGYIELFRASMARRLPEKRVVVAPLSGGRDSRHITLELCHQGVRPDFCLTAEFYPGLWVGNEISAASRLCQTLGLRHVELRQNEPRINAELRKNRITGFTAGICEHSWTLAVRDYLKQEACAVYDGIGGDVLSASRSLSEKRLEWCDKGDYRSLGGDLLKAADERLVERMFCREMAGRLSWESAFERFEEEFLRHTSAPNPIGSFHFWNRTRRHVALSPYALLGATHDVYSPYVDNDLFDFLASLPASMLVDRAFHTDTIHRAFPAVSHIQWGDSEQGGKAYHKHYREFAWGTLRYLFRSGSKGWIRQSYIVPRLTRCLFDKRYSSQTHWIGSMTVFFTQLESVAGREDGLIDIQSN
ncbi:MAG: asparagine synthase-related protein [Blastocatellales bacterium]